jgi:hypothetical protein
VLALAFSQSVQRYTECATLLKADDLPSLFLPFPSKKARKRRRKEEENVANENEEMANRGSTRQPTS